MARRIAILFVFALAGPAAAQAERYELGQRLKAFEKAWDKQTDPAARKRANRLARDHNRKRLAYGCEPPRQRRRAPCGRFIRRG